MVTIDELKEYSNNLMFKMKEEEYKTLSNEFDTFLGWMDYINKIEGLKDVEPMYFPFDLGNVELRSDEPIDSLKSEYALKNAKVVKDGSVIVPKVVDNE
jgi:aspartyl/glutamyl-tRNA(Asn/Gln) amidotransferase C subunit